MLAKIVYTPDFRKNLSRFIKKPEPVPKAPAIIKFPEASKIDLKSDTKSDSTNYSKNYSSTNKSYKPKFNTVDPDYNISSPEYSIPPINFTPTERILTTKPDLNEVIELTNNRYQIKRLQLLKLFQLEQSKLNKIKQSQNSFLRQIDSQDLRNKNPDVCYKESAELLQCFEQNKDCNSFVQAWKECLKT